MTFENNAKKGNCYKCPKRYPGCQDECPDKSTGTFYKSPESEYWAYRAQKSGKYNNSKLRRQH